MFPTPSVMNYKSYALLCFRRKHFMAVAL